MFRHHGKTRTYSHNLKIASVLSIVAGIVNVTGFFAVHELTTNVTGHFAYFMDNIVKYDISNGIVYLLYVFFFFFGSFMSSFLIEFISRKGERFVYIIPATIEIIILLLLGVFGHYLILHYPSSIAFGLLFSMGLQNSLVTTISNAVVRTTHLTGLFTDLGIELSQLFFYKKIEQKQKLMASIRLRITIILSFFVGGVLGGLLYMQIHMHTLFIAAAILLAGLIYDNIKIRLLLLRRKLRNY